MTGVDTGISCSVMNFTKFKELSDLKDLQEMLTWLKMYVVELMKLCDIADIELLYQESECHLPLLVVEGEFPTL